MALTWITAAELFVWRASVMSPAIAVTGNADLSTCYTNQP
jgi:hypothetical protein